MLWLSLRYWRKEPAALPPGELRPELGGSLHVVLVGLDHLLDHLTAHGAGLTAGEVAVVALLQVDADFPWCSFSISKGFEAKFLVTVRQNSHAEFGSSSKFLLCFKMETSTGRARIASSCISPMNL